MRSSKYWPPATNLTIRPCHPITIHQTSLTPKPKTASTSPLSSTSLPHPSSSTARSSGSVSSSKTTFISSTLLASITTPPVSATQPQDHSKPSSALASVTVLSDGLIVGLPKLGSSPVCTSRLQRDQGVCPVIILPTTTGVPCPPLTSEGQICTVSLMFAATYRAFMITIHSRISAQLCRRPRQPLDHK